MWITWIAKYTPTQLKTEDVTEYNNEMRLLFKGDLSAQACLSTIDRKTFDKIYAVIDEIYKIDHSLSLDLVEFNSCQDSTSKVLSASKISRFYDLASELNKKMPQQLGDTFK